jgi:chitodextrinase
VKAILYNKSAFPARALTRSAFRYYFQREGTSAIEVSSPYTQGCPKPTEARQFSGNIWYVEVDCTGQTIAPAGQSAHRMEVQLKIGVPEGGTWDPTNDPSYQATAGPNPRVPAYENGVRIWGQEPGPATPDTAPPSAPGTPVASAVTATGLTLTWPVSTDTGGSGLAGYDVFRENGATDVLVATPTAATSPVTGLAASTAYQFYVVARDGAGNRSAASPAVTVTTPAGGGDTVAPTVPGTPAASAVTATGLTLTWPASTDTGGSGLAGYRVYREAGATDVLVGSPAAATLPVTGLTASTAYQFYVVAVDGAGNASAASAAVSVTTTGGTGGATCAVTYATNEWSTGFTANVTIRNTGTAAINDWTLRFAFPNAGQRAGQGWGATWAQTGAEVSGTNLSYNGSLAAGASTGVGFNGTHTGANPRPTAFTVNGSPCTVA